MKCVVNDGKDAVTMDNTDKYCYDHNQIYDSLMNLYQEVFKAYGSLSWLDYLTKVLDNDNKENWKISLVDASSKKTLPIVADVARVELEQEKRNAGLTS